MFIRLLLIAGIGFLSACTTAKMAVDPELTKNSDAYKITEKPGVFSGERMKFGPFLATKIDRDWTRGSGTTISSKATPIYMSKEKGQNYRYQFTGKGSWKAECRMSGKSQAIGRIGFGLEVGVHCTFISNAGTGSPQSRFEFRLKGPRLAESKGDFKAGGESIRVTPVVKIQGSSLRMGSPTGYYFFSKEKLIAGVDKISSGGPVWLNRKLSQDVRDRVGMVVVALLLLQK